MMSVVNGCIIYSSGSKHLALSGYHIILNCTWLNLMALVVHNQHSAEPARKQSVCFIPC